MTSQSFGLEANRRNIRSWSLGSPQLGPSGDPVNHSWTPGSVPIRNPSEDGHCIDEDATGTTVSAQMQVMLTCLGIAALTIPHLFAQVGWGLGVFILALPAAMSCLSMRQIVFLGEASGQKGMASAFSPHLGGKVGVLLSWILFLLCEFIVAACMAIPCDIVPHLSEDIEWFPAVSKEVVGLLIVAGAGFCAFAKDLSALDRLLKPSIILIIYLMCTVVVRALMNSEGHKLEFVVLERPESSFSKRAFDCLSTGMAAFGAECAILAIYANTEPQFRRPIEVFSNKVIDAPMLLMLLIYIVFGFAGYSEYGANVEANLLKTMGSEWWATIARLGLSLVNAFRVPLFNIVQWYTVLDLIPGLQKIENDPSGLGRALVLTSMNALSLGLLLFLADFGKVMGFLGGVLGVPIFTLLPGSAWLAARFCSSSRLEGSHRIKDVIAVVIMFLMSLFYLSNLATLFR